MLEKTNLRITLTRWAIDIKVRDNNCVEACHFSFFCLVYWNNWMQLDKFLNWFHHFTELWTEYLPGRLLCKVKLKTRGRGKFLKKLWCCVGGGDLKRQLQISSRWPIFTINSVDETKSSPQQHNSRESHYKEYKLMIDMSFYFERRCKISAMLFFFFFCGIKDNLQNFHTPNPPPKKKIFVLQNRFLSPSQALSVDWKNDSGIYLNVCMMYSLFLWGDESSHFPVLKSIGLIYVYLITPQASLSKCKLMNCN